MAQRQTRRRFLSAAAAVTTGGLLSTVGAASAATPPVVLIHGYADTGETPWWHRLESYLEDDGYNDEDIHRIRFGDIPGTTVDSPAEYAACIERELEAITDGTPPADIVAHSMGGLGSRWALEQGGAAPSVSDLITLGTPHQGTTAALLGLLTDGGRDMIPGSEFLETLNGDTLADGVRYTSLWSSTDELVITSDRGEIPSELLAEDDDNINTGAQEHIQLVSDRDVYEQYRDRLGKR